MKESVCESDIWTHIYFSIAPSLELLPHITTYYNTSQRISTRIPSCSESKRKRERDRERGKESASAEGLFIHIHVWFVHSALFIDIYVSCVHRAFVSAASRICTRDP